MHVGARNKRARKVRQREEFDSVKLAAALTPPTSTQGVYSWSLANIRAARDAQLTARFALAARMAESMRSDDALFVAYQNRLAPQKCIGVEIVPAKGARGEAIAAEAEALFGAGGVGIRPDTLADIHGCLVNHGVAFGVVVQTPRLDGSRVDVEMKMWPIEHVRWDPLERCYMTRVDPGSPDNDCAAYGEEPIAHGDGRWVVFQNHDHEPWKQEACLLAAALIWARHANAIRDWAKGSSVHGNAKIIGELPEGYTIDSPEGAAYLELLRVVASVDTPYGIKPKGAGLDYIQNTSNAWQVWAELILNAEKAAARVYLGTDGTLGSQGGAPGVDIGELFGVATTLIQGDLAALTRGIQTGLIEPWCAINFGDSALAPSRRYMMPDADADAVRKSLSERQMAFFDALDRAERRFTIDQDYVNKLAKDYGVVPPVLKVAAPVAPTAPSGPPPLRVAPAA